MGWLWTLVIIWGLFWTATLGAGIGPGYALFAFLVGWAPASLLIWFVLHRATKREKIHAAMLSAAGVQASTGCDHAEKGAGIAINKSAKTLTLLTDGFWKTYPYADVREWETRKEHAGEVVGVGVQGGMAAIGANVRAERKAAANTGLFVSVKDVDHAKWRIEMKDEGMQARWMELLRQELNER